MKILVILLTLFSFVYADQQVFMLDSYDKEIELEAKIISKISSDILNKRAKIYIPDISKKEKEVYSDYFLVSKNCKDADFVFDNKELKNDECGVSKKVYFTNNYKKLISDGIYTGAFFWNKSRPNIVLIKKRLKSNGIVLSSEYGKYIEDIDE